jgi:hypothetical protein
MEIGVLMTDDHHRPVLAACRQVLRVVKVSTDRH